MSNNYFILCKVNIFSILQMKRLMHSVSDFPKVRIRISPLAPCLHNIPLTREGAS